MKIPFHYSLHTQALGNVKSAKYFGINDTPPYISLTLLKILDFPHMYLYLLSFASKGLNECKIFVRHKLQYAASTWNFYSKFEITQHEKIKIDMKEMAKHKWYWRHVRVSPGVHLLRSVGISPLCTSSTAVSVRDHCPRLEHAVHNIVDTRNIVML